MPYRAILNTLIAVALALVIAAMWVRAVTPMVERSTAATTRNASTNPAAKAVEAAHEQAGILAHPDRGLRKFINGISLLTLLLICAMFVVGLFAAFREWVRYQTEPRPPRGKSRTKYVDAWKLAGERAKAEPENPGDAPHQ